MNCPFHNHETYLKYLVRNMKNGQDNVILYEGEEGSGKSNAALWDAILIHEKMNKSFDPSSDSIFTKKQWEEKFDSNQKEQVYHLDEFENIAFSRDFAKMDNKNFVRMIQQARILRSTLFCCLPYFQFADIYFRQGRFRVRVHLERLSERRISCEICSDKHESREATYFWRRRSEDPKTGEIIISWEEIFRAIHCPLKNCEPELWKKYEGRKEASVREESSTKRNWKSRPEGGIEPGENPNPREKKSKRARYWGALTPAEKVNALARAQDMLLREGIAPEKLIPLTPKKPRNITE